MLPRAKPLLVYDGDCGFCLGWVNRWRPVTKDQVEYIPFQEVADQFPQISKEQFNASIQLVLPDGRIFQGAEAVFRIVASSPGYRWPLWLYQKIPGVAALAEWGYRFVARHRSGLSGAAQCRIEPPASFLISSRIFLRLLGVIYLIAFLSFWTQVDGLIGSRGILPAADFLKAVGEKFGPQAYWLVPSLCWLNPSDIFLNLLCGGGVLLSIGLIFGITPPTIPVLLWAFYLSLVSVGREFMGFQWDNLLLEAGFLAIFLARPSPTIAWLFRWLLFRLTFSSGLVKLASGDLTWRNLTALTYHYETQPLPPWTAWYFHHLPVWFHQMSCLILFVVELLVPFLFFAPRRWRWVGAAATIGLQLLIIATGNYCFFNLLTIFLCLFLIEDSLWPQRWRGAAHLTPARHWPSWIVALLTAMIFICSSVQLSGLSRFPVSWPRPVIGLAEFCAPFRSVNGYGLFAVMTTSRSEIIVEGSPDGQTWLPYEFKYKPGDPQRMPQFVAPHQPRLDWQMWFAALGSCQQNPWFVHLCARLLEGSPAVLRLLKANPFPNAPPHYVRAVLYDYHFSDPAERKATGAWWRRTQQGIYCPTLSLTKTES